MKPQALRLFSLLLVCSGAAGLMHEVLVIRQLAIQLGVSQWAVVLTTGTFMLGLSAGAWLGVRYWPNHLPQAWRRYRLLEGLFALLIVCQPLWFQQLYPPFVAWMQGSSLASWQTMLMLVCMLVLFLPAVLLGLNFPLLLRCGQGLSLSLGRVYGLNLLGAALGALLPLFSLPLLGWWASLWLASGLSLTAVLLSFAVSQQAGDSDAAPPLRAMPVIPRQQLLAYALIGALALMLEMAWVRLFSLSFLRSEYLLATVLAVFLAGSALGSLLWRFLARYPGLHGLPLLAALLLLISLALFAPLSAWNDLHPAASFGLAMLQQVLIIALLMLPLSVLLGAWLPLLASAQQGNDPRHGVQLYAANALGGALGTALFAWLLLPWLHTVGAMLALVGLFWCVGRVWVPHRLWWQALPVLVLLAFFLGRTPAAKDLLPSRFAGSHTLLHHEDALADTRVLEQADGSRLLLSDLQRMDASSEPFAVRVQRHQGALGGLLNPGGKMLFLGMGTGITLAGAQPYLAAGDTALAVELSAGSLHAAKRYFAALNHVGDPRLHWQRDDIRHYLASTPEHYATVVGDLFHPDLAGRGALLSVQQFQAVRRVLRADGVYVQWLALNQFDLASLQTLLRSFQRVFPHPALFLDNVRLALVGRADDGPVLPGLFVRRGADTARAQWLGRYWGWPQLPAGPVEDFWRPTIEYRLARVRYQDGDSWSPVLHWLQQQRPGRREALFATLPGSAPNAAQRTALLAGQDMALGALLARLQGDDVQADRLLQLAHQASPHADLVSLQLADRMLILMPQRLQTDPQRQRQAWQRILSIEPDHAATLKRLWQDAVQAGNADYAARYQAHYQRLNPYDPDLSTR